MPLLCCGGKDGDVVTDPPLSKDGETTTKEQAQEDEPKDPPAPKTEKEERELAESIYHDARQSLTESMIYRPATQSVIIRQNLCLDTNPEDLLKTAATAGATATAAGGARDSVAVVKDELENQQLIVQAGYPGSLTDKELEACLEFRKLVKDKRADEASYYEMVHILKGVEEEAFAICRIMRARKFVVEDAIKLMTGNMELWKLGKSNDYYPDLQTPEGLGANCPMSVIHSQLPLIHSGLAMNGSLVFYFPVENISLEALDCLTDLENFEAYIWNLLVHRYPQYAKTDSANHPNIKHILAELTVVIDLKGLQRSLFTDRVIQVLKSVLRVLNCFPEFLNKAVVMSAPYFFSAIWLIFRQLMDARTVAKIDIFSTEKAGNACLQKLVDSSELLSNYGGSGPSYDEVLHKLRHKGTIRQMVERFFLDHHHHNKGEHSYEFDLAAEEMATIMVFTRSTNGAQFTLSKTTSGGEVEMLNEMEVKPTDEGGDPYAREVTSDINGPGQFTVFAKTSSHHKEYFLVQVRVYPM